MGKASMNTTMVDVTDIIGVQANDEVVVFGRQGFEEITAEETERKAVVFCLSTTLSGVQLTLAFTVKRQVQ